MSEPHDPDALSDLARLRAMIADAEVVDTAGFDVDLYTVDGEKFLRIKFGIGGDARSSIDACLVFAFDDDGSVTRVQGSRIAYQTCR